MNFYKARIKEPNSIGNNYLIETGNYSDPVAIPIKPLSTYSVGQEVLCLDMDDSPVIIGVLPQQYLKKPDDGREEILGTYVNSKASAESKFVLDSRFQRVGEHSNSGVEMPESLPGDNVIAGGPNNSLKLLGEGTNILDSGTARVITNRSTASVDIFCSEFSVSTSMGELRVGPEDNGQFSLEFKGNPLPSASSPNTQTTGISSTPVAFKLGANVELTSSQGHGIKISPSGKIILSGQELLFEKDNYQVPLSNSPGSDSEAIYRKHSVISETSAEYSSADSTSVSAGGNYNVSVGREHSLVVSGPSVLDNPEVVANPAGVYSSRETVLAGGKSVEVGNLVSSGGKYKVNAYGDVHIKSSAGSRGGSALIRESSGLPSATNGLWDAVTYSGNSLHTSLLPSTPSVPTDGLPNPWSSLPPVPGGTNPVLTGVVKYSQLQLSMAPFLQAMSAALTACSTAPGLTPAAITAIGNGAVACQILLSALPFSETKSLYINELPV